MSQTEIWHVDLTFIFTPTDLDTHVIIFFFIFWDAHWKIYRLITGFTSFGHQSLQDASIHFCLLILIPVTSSSSSVGYQVVSKAAKGYNLSRESWVHFKAAPCPSRSPWVLDSSPLSFVTDRVCSLDRIFRHSQVEGLQFVGSRSLSLLFADYTLMLAS